MAKGLGENIGGCWTVESDGYQLIIKRYAFMKDPDGSIRKTERPGDNMYFSSIEHLVKQLRASRIMDLVKTGEQLLPALEKAQSETMAWLNQHYPALPQGLEGYPAMMDLMAKAELSAPAPTEEAEEENTDDEDAEEGEVSEEEED